MPDILRCEDCADDLSALLDGELELERAREVRAHVEGCEACQHRLSALGRVDGALASLSGRAVPDDLAARLQERLGASASGATSPPSGVPLRVAPHRERRWLRRPAMAAALAAAAAVVLYLAVGGEPTSAPTPVPGEALVQTPEVVPERADSPELRYAREDEPEPEAAIPAPPEPAVSRDPEPEPETLAARVLPPSPGPGAVAGEGPLEEVPDAELALALELDTIEDLEVIANLDLLEVLVSMEEGAG